MDFEKNIITEQGQNLFAKIQAGLCKLVITNVASGDGIYTQEEKDKLEERRSLKSTRQVLNVSKQPQILNDNQVRVDVILSNQNVKESYYFREWGLFADDPDEGEILYSISLISPETEEYIPSAETSQYVKLNLCTYFTLGNLSEVIVKDNVFGYVNQVELELHKQNIGSDENYGHVMASSEIPKPLGEADSGTDNGKYAREGHVHPKQTDISGNAQTASKLQTPRKINGVDFDGSTDITLASNATEVQLTTEDLDQITSADGTRFYYADNSNTIKNKPEGVSSFSLLPTRSGDGNFSQFLFTENSDMNMVYLRSGNTEGWTQWKRIDTDYNHVNLSSLSYRAGNLNLGGYISFVKDSYMRFYGTAKGAIKITLPTSWASLMMRFDVNIYVYATNATATYTLGGFNYVYPSDPSGGYWVNPSAYCCCPNSSPQGNLKVRFGHDGSKCCIYIGETTMSTAYCMVDITNIHYYNAWGPAHTDFKLDRGWKTEIVDEFCSNIDCVLENTNQNTKSVMSLERLLIDENTLQFTDDETVEDISDLDDIALNTHMIQKLNEKVTYQQKELIQMEEKITILEELIKSK